MHACMPYAHFIIIPYNNLHYQVFQAEVNSQQKRLEKDRLRKSSTAYKEKRKAARYSISTTSLWTPVPAARPTKRRAYDPQSGIL